MRTVSEHGGEKKTPYTLLSPPVWLLVCSPVRRAHRPGEQPLTPYRCLPLSWLGAAPAGPGWSAPGGTGTGP